MENIERQVGERVEEWHIRGEVLAGNKFKCSVAVTHSIRDTEELNTEIMAALNDLMFRASESGYNQQGE